MKEDLQKRIAYIENLLLGLHKIVHNTSDEETLETLNKTIQVLRENIYDLTNKLSNIEQEERINKLFNQDNAVKFK